jgi:pimeloyl-ACP methyl ester carboxylesterase
MPFATRPRGVRIHYETRGRGPTTAVLIQGLGLSSRFWFDVPDRLAAGDDPWHVVTPDHRGVGRSDRPWGPYTMAGLADDVMAVLDHAGVEKAYVAGISLGGMVAQHVALRHPSRVAGLVLLATTAGFPHVRLNPLAVANFISLPMSGRLRRSRLDASFARLLLSRKDVARSAELLSGWPEALQTEPTTFAGYAALFSAVLGHSTGRRLRKISCPTVIVTGDDDSLLPHHNSRLLARLVPDAHLEVIQGGHIVTASDPDVVHRALRRARAMVRTTTRDGDRPAATADDKSAGAAGVVDGDGQMLRAPVRSR